MEQIVYIYNTKKYIIEVFYFSCIVREIQLKRKNKDDSDEEDANKRENSGNFMVRLERIERAEANLKYIKKKSQQ